ncbi:MAG: alpha/beta hydrolase [Filimonas sp.]|nr:alpha/beta hydrolase [Filimonas sp.]
MNTFFLPYQQSQVHFYQYGNGPKKIFCFHGHGEDGSSFAFLEGTLQDTHTLYAIDMPLHGKTVWHEEDIFSAAVLWEIISLLNPLEEKILLLGYSMGGRMALCLLENNFIQVEKLVLIAPDGLKNSFWYWSSTQTRLGVRIFKYTSVHPEWLLKLAKLSQRTKLLHKDLYKVAQYYLSDAERRQLLYKRWMFVRSFNPSLARVKEIVIQCSIPIRMLFGRHDSIILFKNGLSFSKSSGRLITTAIAEGGHRLLKEKYIPNILKVINE